MSRKILRFTFCSYLVLLAGNAKLFANGQEGPLTKAMPPALTDASKPATDPGFVLHDKLSHQILGHAKRPIVQQTAFSGFWRTDGGFVAKMRVKNALITGPLEVAPVLYMADGTEYQLPTVVVPTSGVVSININQALAQAPPQVMTHLSTFGSASLSYRHASGGHLIASVSMQDTSRSLVLSYPFTESLISRRHSHAGTASSWEGAWWKHDTDVQGFVAVTNATDHDTQAQIRLISANGAFAQPKTVSLKPHATQMLALENTQGGLGAVGDLGGIRVEYNGEPHAIAVAGGLLNAKEGYSANIPFVQAVDSQYGPVMLGSTGIMVGKPDAMMRFPANTTFTPYLVLRNATAKALPVTLLFSYMAQDGPVSIQTSENLPPQATKRLDLPNILQAQNLKDFSGSINIGASYTGLPSDLLMASGSVDQTGNYVFEVQPQALTSTRKKLGNYWDLDAGSNTMYSLWNPTDNRQDVVITLHYDDGVGKYKIPVQVDPQSSVMLDLKNIIESNAPDAEGNVFPAKTSEGSATIESADGPTGQMKLIISGAVFNVVTGTCFGCCVPCCGVSDLFLDPASDVCTVGDTEQFEATEEECDGSTFNTTSGTWSSTNTGVMTVNSTGLMSAVSSGNATLNFQSTLPASSDCGQPLPGECPMTNFPATAPVTAKPSITSVTPNMGLVGTPVSVTIKGTGFAAGATVSAGSNISVTHVSVSSATKITATFTSTNSASAGGNQSVTVTVNSQPSYAQNFFVQVPSHLGVITDTGATQTFACGPFIGANYNGIQRQILYSVLDQQSQPIPANMTVSESFGAISNSCGGPNTPTPTTGATTDPTGTFPGPDLLALCSTACLPANGSGNPTGSCTLKVNQTWTANGFSVRTNLLTYSCNNVTVTPQ